jgi:mediator of RNA polymerase II transcription subunit 14
VTTVKLKYSQPVSGPVTTAAAKTSRNVTYDPATSLVSFRSTNPETCVTEFLEQWDRVERVLEIAREIGSMKYEKGWEDVQLLSFDLEQIVFAYHTVCGCAWKALFRRDLSVYIELHRLDTMASTDGANGSQ